MGNFVNGWFVVGIIVGMAIYAVERFIRQRKQRMREETPPDYTKDRLKHKDQLDF